MAVTIPASREALVRADTSAERLRPVEYLLLGYIAIISVVAAFRMPTNPGCAWLLAAHALIALLVYLVTRPGLGPVGRAIREIYPLLLLVALYVELDVLNGGGSVTVHDALIQQWELRLFGEQVSHTWWQRAPSAFWSFVLHGAYLAYYLILSLPALYFGLRRDLVSLRRFLLLVMATFFVCYLFFIFLPVAGPYYMFPRPTGAFVENRAAYLVYRALESGSSYGAAFPSSHVAATLSATIAAWCGSRRLGAVIVVPLVLLTVSVVYCQMHYAVDAITGLAVGGIVSWVALRLTERGA